MRTISFENLHNFSPQSLFEEKVSNFLRNWFSNQSRFEFFTSGSTGEPQKIELSRTQLENSAKQTIDWLQLRSNQNALLCLPPDYIAGTMVLVRVCLAKMNLVLLEPSEKLSELFENESQSLHLASFVPNQWKNLLNFKEGLNTIFKNARGVLIGGANLDEQTKINTNAICQFPVYLTYGMTETVSHIAFQTLSVHPTHDFEILPQVRISTENDCLVIESPSTLFKKITTNDLVRIKNEKHFEILGRANRIINSAGLKINPVEIEEILQRYFHSKSISNTFFVTGVPDDFYGEIVSLFMEGNFNLDLSIIKENLKAEIDSKKLPKKLYSIPQFIYTTSGKIDQLKTKELINQTNETN